jgi:hypothetical protein
MTSTATHHHATTGTRPYGAPRAQRARQSGRSVPRILAGVVMVLVGALGFGVYALHADPGIEVLVVAQPVRVGAPLTDTDLRTVKVAADASLHVLPASARPSVMGKTAAVPLLAGQLLTQEVLGAAADPPAGQSVLGLAAKPGHFPAGLAPGAAVLVIVTPLSGTDTPTQASGVVRDVQPADTGGVTVVTVQMAADAAVRIASAAGEVTLVQQAAGR